MQKASLVKIERDVFRHILGLLNSKLITWYFKHCIGTTSGVGTNRWLKYTIEQIPIAPANMEIEQMVNLICSNFDATIDEKIDNMVCKQYGLDEEEINFIVNH